MKLAPFLFVLIHFMSGEVKAQYHHVPFAKKVGKEQQYIDLVSGSATGLRNARKINIIYDYSYTRVGEFATEQQYLDTKVAEYNEKDPEKGQRFVDNWFASRKQRYEPKFEEQFNIHLSKAGISSQNYSTDGDFTLYVITLRTEPGFHAGVAKKPAYIDVECVFTDASGTEVLRYIIRNASGSQAANFDFDTGSRLAESYAKCAKEIAKEISGELGF